MPIPIFQYSIFLKYEIHQNISILTEVDTDMILLLAPGPRVVLRISCPDPLWVEFPNIISDIECDCFLSLTPDTCSPSGPVFCVRLCV